MLAYFSFFNAFFKFMNSLPDVAEQWGEIYTSSLDVVN